MRIVLLLTLSQIAQAQLYQPPAACETRVHNPVSVTYTHPLTGLQRTVRIVVEEPLGVAGAMPVVVWMHGGAGGGTPRNLAEWRGVTARACYLSVTIGHPWPDEAQARKLCAWMGRSFPDDCGEARQGQVKLLNVERPFDLRAVLDHLLTEWKGRVDPGRIAAGGHSAGAGAALMAAGAARKYENRLEVFSDPRPRAFLAFSPQGPGNDGFLEGAWDGVKRPVLIGTGAGDTTGGESATDRIRAFEALPGPDKHLLYVEDAAPHGRFGLGRSRCASTGGPIPEPDCDRVISWLGATAVAFLDAYVRERKEALDWLNGGGVEKATDGVARMRTQ
jgi:predicted dienelactone hydrolase